ncbi:MAG: hypothetical protein R2752_12940 [Vicinamibacterales bacterium]
MVVVRTDGHAARDAEVEQPRAPIGGEDDVLRLQVAVDHARRVRGLKCRRHRIGEFEGLAGRHRPAREPRGERLALDVLHDDEVARRRIGRDFVHAADTGMVHRGDGAGLAQQLAPRVVVGGAREELDGDPPLQTGIPGKEDLAHTAGAQGALQAIVPDESARLRPVHWKGLSIPDRLRFPGPFRQAPPLYCPRHRLPGSRPCARPTVSP